MEDIQLNGIEARIIWYRGRSIHQLGCIVHGDFAQADYIQSDNLTYLSGNGIEMKGTVLTQIQLLPCFLSLSRGRTHVFRRLSRNTRSEDDVLILDEMFGGRLAKQTFSTDIESK